MDDQQPALLPEHLADLRKSGLSTQIITAMRVHSVPASEIPRFLGFAPHGVESALAFPYLGSDNFSRLKLFPPQQDEEGRTIKYLQPKGSGVHLYVLPQVAKTLSDPAVPLYITEGEKKCALLVQVGKTAVGLAGIWSFRNGEPHRMILQLEEIDWKGRSVYLVPDSDARQNDQVLLAVYSLARMLEQRGAVVLIVRIPDLPNVEKTGVDDYVTAKGAKVFQRLCEKAVPLSHPMFRLFRLRKKKQAAPSPETLPAELKGRQIHPALHFEAAWASVGAFRLGSNGPGWFLVTSQRQLYAVSDVPGSLLVKPLNYPSLLGRWPEEELQAFLNGATGASFAEMAALIIEQVRSLVELKHSQEYAVVTMWMIGTYFHLLFAAFPRLNLFGEKGSGKSKLEALLAEICFNGLLRVNPTPAVLFRLASALRPTLCLDEVEGLSTEDRREILAIINAGYKRGTAVDRVEGEAREIISYQVYTPMSLAGIKELNTVTEDRAIVLVMQKAQDSARLNAAVDSASPLWGKVRGMGYQLALTCFGEVAAAYEGLQAPVWLRGRERELWSPLLALAKLIDTEAKLDLTEDILEIARSQVEERSDFSPDSEALLMVLEEKLGDSDSIQIRPGDLKEAMEAALNRKQPISSQAIGAVLRRLGFQRDKRGRLGKEVGSIYVVMRQRIEQLKALYGPPALLATLQPPQDCNSENPLKQNGL